MKKLVRAQRFTHVFYSVVFHPGKTTRAAVQSKGVGSMLSKRNLGLSELVSRHKRLVWLGILASFLFSFVWIFNASTKQLLCWLFLCIFVDILLHLHDIEIERRKDVANAPRSLTALQRECLVDELKATKDLPQQKFPVQLICYSHPEAISYGKEFVRVFNEAGWDCLPLDTFISGHDEGIRIYSQSMPSDAATEIVQTAFDNAGIRYKRTSVAQDIDEIFPSLLHPMVKIEIWARESPD